MERCPCCNARLTGAVCCPRCQADLTGVIGSADRAQQLFANAVRLWFADERHLAIVTLAKAIRLKQLPSALILRDFIMQRQYRRIMALLAEARCKEAKQAIGLLAELTPENPLLIQLSAFTEHLATKAR